MGDGGEQGATGEVPRRTVLRGALGAAVLGAGATALSACGGGSSGGSTAAATSPAGTGSGSATVPGPAGSSSGGTVLTKASDVPVGGGIVLASSKVVVTQPTAGQYKAFSSTCTHMGCQVKDVANGTINCPCHGSKFNIADGSVANGPAQKPLPEVAVTLSGASIVES